MKTLGDLLDVLIQDTKLTTDRSLTSLISEMGIDEEDFKVFIGQVRKALVRYNIGEAYTLGMIHALLLFREEITAGQGFLEIEQLTDDKFEGEYP